MKIGENIRSERKLFIFDSKNSLRPKNWMTVQRVSLAKSSALFPLYSLMVLIWTSVKYKCAQLKWLPDPRTSKQRKGSKHTSPHLPLQSSKAKLKARKVLKSSHNSKEKLKARKVLKSPHMPFQKLWKRTVDRSLT